MAEYLYAGLTIGPIYTMSQYARATVEQWLASYMFSRYAKSLAKHLCETYQARKDAEFLMISPSLILDEHLEEVNRENPLQDEGIKVDKRIGLYSDRIFFRVHQDIRESEVKAAIDGAIEQANNEIAVIMSEVLALKPEDCLLSVRRALYVRYVFHRADRLNLHKMNGALDEPELYAGDLDSEEDGATDLWMRFFNKSRLREEICEWIWSSGVQGADIGEVAGIMRKDDPRRYAATPASYLKSEPARYYAVVVADGDSMGTLIGLPWYSPECDRNTCTISRQMLRYCAMCSNAVVDYGDGAYPVYFGGDDMEFFVPLYGTKKKDDQHFFSLMDLVTELDSIFKTLFSAGEAGSTGIKWPEDGENLRHLVDEARAVIGSVIETAKKENNKIQCTPSLSIGINVVYYKYPLDRAISEAHALLGKAKGAVYQDGTKKHSVCVHLRKHSGQQSEFIVHKAGQESPWTAVSDYLRLHEDEKILHAIHHRLLAQSPVLLCLLQLEKEKREKRLSAWLKQMQKESPIGDNYHQTLQTLLTALWDGREKLPEPRGAVEDEEKKAKEKRAREASHYINTLDGVFRFGELMQGWQPEKKDENKEQEATRR